MFEEIIALFYIVLKFLFKCENILNFFSYPPYQITPCIPGKADV